ncbi:choice-of-anchor D domain-containing protein [Nostoc sp. WHI]|uniref:choice-of-anchor D domain-containing protein n=1 Tax=Nostoc sp. WHI TaxID=2650611 RepID=UPI0018C4CD11|nr:choice-of-anchor D domain-containing protein [Nostoc sp. WHI]MBG1270076.1 choice-of-anchor D domain-containing protein [Nostoc sp. WHI]
MAGKTYYVSGTGNDQNNGLKEGAAFRTLQKAGDLVQAGDTVYVMNGTYEQTEYFNSPVLNINQKNGTSDAPITFTAYPGHDPLIKSANFQAIQVMASSYIVIEGLTLVGNNDQITLKYAQEQQGNKNNPTTNGSGIYVVLDKAGIKSHHIVIKDNTISKFPASGIVTNQADYITIENNLVYETCFYSPWGANAISLLLNSDVDNNTTDYKMIVRGNISHSNYTFIPWWENDEGKATEGSGIMIDLANGLGSDGVAYKGRTLIANNVSYNNGGAGIQVFKSSNVDVVNNTTYKNSNHPDQAGFGEIFLNSATKIRAENNIMYAKSNGESFAGSDKENTINNNLIYNTSKWNFTGKNAITGKDPLFVDAAKGNFALLTGSPAIDAGSSTFNGITKNVPQDGDGNGTAAIDIGAYEAATNNTPTPEIQVFDDTVDIVDDSTTAINFGDAIVGSILTKTFTINNTGIAALNLSNLKLPDGFSLVGTLPATLAVKATTSITVALNTNTPGTYTGNFSLSNNDINESPFNFAISGRVTAPEIQVLNGTVDIVDGSSAAINFGDAAFGSTVTKTFTIKNTGTSALNLSNLKLPDGFSLVGTLPATLAVKASASIKVALNTKTPGTYAGSFSLSNNDIDESPFDFAISGTVKPAPAPEIEVLSGTVNIVDGSTTAINFGDVAFGSTVTKTFTIKNTGTATLNLSNLKLPNGFSLVGTFPYTVAAKASKSITVALNTNTPTPGTYAGSFSLSNNDSDENPFNFAISGTVKPPLANTIYLLNGTDSSEYLKGNAPANKIYGFGGQDTIIGNLKNDQLFGGDGHDTLWGGNDDDLLYGDSGNDKLSGDNDNDTLFGGIGDDQLLGGAGNDWLYGGNDKDVLTGGYGVDTFVFASAEGTDSITDFVVGTDKLALSGGLNFGQLLIQQQGSQAWIVDSSDNQVLVKLDNVTSTTLLAQTSTTFITI